MPILHGTWSPRGLLLWGEALDDGARPLPRRGGRRAASPRALERALPAADLAQALQAWIGPAADGEPETVVLWLPTVGGQAVLGAEAAPAASLARWTVPGLRLPPRALWSVLPRCAADADGGPVRPAPDLRYWAAALRFVAALAVRQLFLPTLRQVAGRWEAGWEPVLAGRAGEVLERLAEAMPPACRALGDGEAPVAPAARAVLRAFVIHALEALGRAATEGVAPPEGLVASRADGAWVRALWTGEALRGAAPEVAELAERVRRWAEPLRAHPATGFRLCLRLEEPREGSDDTWWVAYLLQAEDDPSLLVPAEAVWTDPRAPREVLLGELGRAAAVCPEVAASLRGEAPTGFALDTSGAYAFLTETAWVLEEAGFGVLWPSWWVRGGPRLRLAARAHAAAPFASAGRRLGLDEVVAFRWEVALGDEALTAEELHALAEAKAPLVRLRGAWVHADAAEVRAALELLRGGGRRQGTWREALRLAAGLPVEGVGLPVAAVEAEGVLGRLAEVPAPDEVPPPAGLAATLRPYQLRGYAWLHRLTRWGLGACLADDMGLGKTVQTLALLLRDREEGARDPILLVCPTSLVGNWLREAARFAPSLRVLAHHGPSRPRGEAFAAAAREHDVVVTTYPLLVRDLPALEAVRWRGVVLDEAQNIKNPEARQARAARALRTDWRVALTGTPVENGVGDLWSLMEFLNPGLLGSQAAFRRAFLVPVQVDRDPEATRRLRALTGPFLLRRRKDDPDVAPDLPPKLERQVFCTLTREQASLYAAVLEDLDRRLRDPEVAEPGVARRGLVLSVLTRLKQVCNHPAHLLGDRSPLGRRSGKLNRLTEMLEEVLAAGEQALVFTQFAEMGALLQGHLRDVLGREVLFLHGGVPAAARQDLVERFQQGRAPVFVLSLRAGGTGLNLTAATHVFHFDRWWNPAVEDQATDRAYRIGQTRRVQVHKLLCAGTVEERVDAVLASKRDLADQLVGSGEAWIAELDDARLRELLALSPESVGEDEEA